MTHTFNLNRHTSRLFLMYENRSVYQYRRVIVERVRSLSSVFRYCGYMYLNEVYEAIGMEWNPFEANTVFIQGGDHSLTFDVSDPVKVDGIDTIVVTMEYT